MVAALIAALSLCGAARAAAVTVDRIVVTVGGEAITWSRIQFVQAFLAATGGEGMGRAVPGELDAAAVQRILEDDAIIYSLASRLPMVEASEAEIADRIAWFHGVFPTEDALNAFVERWGFDAERQRAFFARRELIEEFIELKIGSFADLPERELRAWYEERAERYGAPFDEVHSQVGRDYAREQRGAAYGDWITSYRRNHRDMIRSPSPPEPDP